MSKSPEKYRYRMEIQQMMFVTGETNDPPVKTTALIEDIVRSQVIELVSIGYFNSIFHFYTITNLIFYSYYKPLGKLQRETLKQ